MSIGYPNADAFAGTGKQDVSSEETQELLIPLEELKGSVSRVLDIGGFDNYYFNDINEAHCDSLKRLISEREMQNKARVSCADANEFVTQFCENLKPNDRAVLFVDPYKHELNWNTLGIIPRSERIDLWLLVPIGEILRLAPNSRQKLTSAGADILNTLLGTNEWQDRFYQPPKKPVIDDLFGDSIEDQDPIRIGKSAVEDYVTERLKSIFPLVMGPHPLNNAKKSQLFSLYCCISSKSKTAQGLARKVGGHIFNQAKQRGF